MAQGSRPKGLTPRSPTARSPTARILTTLETHLPLAELTRILDQIEQACAQSDIAAIRRLLVEARTDYQADGKIVDPFVEPLPPSPGEIRHLTLVSGGSSST